MLLEVVSELSLKISRFFQSKAVERALKAIGMHGQDQTDALVTRSRLPAHRSGMLKRKPRLNLPSQTLS